MIFQRWHVPLERHSRSPKEPHSIGENLTSEHRRQSSKDVADSYWNATNVRSEPPHLGVDEYLTSQAVEAVLERRYKLIQEVGAIYECK